MAGVEKLPLAKRAWIRDPAIYGHCWQKKLPDKRSRRWTFFWLAEHHAEVKVLFWLVVFLLVLFFNVIVSFAAGNYHVSHQLNCRLQNSRIFCERARSSNESSGANVKTESETGTIGASRLLLATFDDFREKTTVL